MLIPVQCAIEELTHLARTEKSRELVRERGDAGAAKRLEMSAERNERGYWCCSASERGCNSPGKSPSNPRRSRRQESQVRVAGSMVGSYLASAGNLLTECYIPDLSFAGVEA